MADTPFHIQGDDVCISRHPSICALCVISDKSTVITWSVHDKDASSGGTTDCIAGGGGVLPDL